MKTLNVEIVEKDLSGMKEYCIVSDKADLIYSTYIYEDLLSAWAAVNRYITACKRNKGKSSAKKSKTKNRHVMILKYISEIQKKNLKAGRHNETCNYFYNGDNTMVVSLTAAAIFPQYLERPAYCPEPQKQGAYNKLEKLFNNSAYETLSISPVIIDDSFYYEIKTTCIGPRAAADGTFTSYLDQKVINFLLDIFGSIDEIQKNLVSRESGTFTFMVDNIKVLLVAYTGNIGNILRQEQFDILKTELLDNYFFTRNNGLISSEEAAKRFLSGQQVADIKNNLQAFFNFKKSKSYNINYDHFLAQFSRILNDFAA